MPEMFRVFTAVLYGVVLSIASVNCTIEDGDIIAELTEQLLHLVRTCRYANDAFQMKLYRLDDRNATCNDGTPAGYYLRKVHGSKRWIVYLEGGWFCDSAASCRVRHHRMKELMSSKRWSSTKRGIGLLSPDPRENPSWWNANHVYVPYCSSDAWSGNASSWETGERFSFLGTRILARVIEELLPLGLYHAKHLLLAGSSAGGIGVILNLDRIAMRLKMAGAKVQVRGLADSGWYLMGHDCPLTRRCRAVGHRNCDPAQAIEQGMAYWRGIVPDDCARRNPTKKWKCYFGEHVYRTDSKSPKPTPLFVFQWLYDVAQLAWTLSGSFNVPSEATMKDIDVQCVLSLGEKLKQSFNRTKGAVCAVFAPSCVSHTILTRNDWLKVMVGGKTLNDALDAWYQSTGHSSGSCNTLIESECNYPQCDKTCFKLSLPPLTRKSPRSQGVPIIPRRKP